MILIGILVWTGSAKIGKLHSSLSRLNSHSHSHFHHYFIFFLIRCHRIGQTREVNIYRFVCEATIEENMLAKAQQKEMLDKMVITDGGFTTDFWSQPKVDWREIVNVIAPDHDKEINDEPE